MIMLNCDCHSQSNFMGTTISFNVYSLHFYAAKLSCCRNFTFFIENITSIPHDPQCVTPSMHVCVFCDQPQCLTP